MAVYKSWESPTVLESYLFGVGKLEDGCAVLSLERDAAYWVKEGKAYAVNDVAKRLSPGLDQAPAAITYAAVAGVVDVLPGTGITEAVDGLYSGDELNEEQVAEYEATLKQHPDDLKTRGMLLGYYQENDYDEAERRLSEHLFWFIQNHPEDPVSANVHVENDLVYSKALSLWKEQVLKHPDELVIQYNAAQFAEFHDHVFAAACFKRCSELVPARPEYHSELAYCYRERSDEGESGDTEIAKKAFFEFETAVSLTKDPDERACLLEQAVQYAFDADAYDKAKTYANELINYEYRSHSKLDHTISDGNVCFSQWSDYGQTDLAGEVHDVKIILGGIALRNGDIAQAKQYLIDAARPLASTPPFLCNLDMELAKKLLALGEKTTVLEYLDLCTKAIEASSPSEEKERGEQILKWKRIIEEGGVPDFSFSSSMGPGIEKIRSGVIHTESIRTVK